MSALHAAYLTEIIEAHREGLRILRELATAETDPAERRRLAIALVRARPIKDPDPDEDTPSHPPRQSKHPTSSPTHRDRTSTPKPAADHSITTASPAAQAPPASTAQPRPDTAAPEQPAPQTNPHSEIHTPQSQSPLPPPPPGFKDCTHPAFPPYPGMHIKQLLKRARSA